MKRLALSFIFFLSLVCGLAYSEDRIVEFPAPTGSYAIGRMSFRWTDTARPEEITAEPTDQRELVVHLWYPAQTSSNATPAPYFPDLEALKKELKIAGALRLVRTRAVADTSVATAQTSYPVILLLNGNEMNSAQYSFFVEELVSHGYIVAGLDSPGEARAVLLSNNKIVSYDNSPWASFQKVFVDPKIPLEQQPFPKLYRARVDARVADAKFVLAQLAKLNTEKGNRFAGHLDLMRVGIFGHSHGGVAAANAGIADARFRAVLNLDGMAGRGPYFPDANDNGPQQPFMLLTRQLGEPSDKDLEKMETTREQFRARRETVVSEPFARLKAPGYRLVLNGAKHNSFSNDAMMEAALLKPKDLDAQRRYAQIVRAYLLAFFDRHLCGKTVPLLDAASPAYPEIEFRSWKP